MKRAFTILTIVIFCFAVCITNTFAGMKSEAKIDISDAKKLLQQVGNDKTLQEFIPYKNYYDAKVYLDSAIYQYEEESEYVEAAYYAVLASVELETTLVIAKTRLAINKKLQIERDYFKNLASSASRKATLKIAIAEANLKKEGSSYKAVLMNNLIFKRSTFVLTDKGKNILGNIYDVLKLYPGSKVKIVGHTLWRDTNTSVKMADSVSSYLTTNKGLSSRRVEVKGMGKDVPMEINRTMRRVDRVEVIIMGIR